MSKSKAKALRKPRKNYGKAKQIRIRTPREHPELANNTTFKRGYRGRQYTLVIKKSDGQTLFGTGGVEYSSPSAAAEAILRRRGRKGTVNGWDWWNLYQESAA